MEYFEELNEYNEQDIDITNVIEPPTNTKRFICDECGQSYKYFSGLYTHKRIHDPNYIKKYSCSLCDYSHDNIYHLYSHINAHNNKNEQAEIIKNERELIRQSNKQRNNYNQKDKMFDCPYCDKKYYYRQTIQAHLKTHDKNRVYKFSCDECNFKCDHKSQFSRHKNSH